MSMVYLVTFAIFLSVIFFLSLGVIIANKRLRGSCGGVQVVGPDGEALSCATCPNRDKNPNCKNQKT